MPRISLEFSVILDLANNKEFMNNYIKKIKSFHLPDGLNFRVIFYAILETVYNTIFDLETLKNFYLKTSKYVV